MDIALKLQASSELPLYKALSAAIQAAIYSGQLKPGQPLPSIRQMASSYNTSPATVIRAYEQLASQGLIETLAKSGTRVKPCLILKSNDRASQSNSSEVRDNLPISRYLENIHLAYEIGEPHGTANYYGCDLKELPVSLWQNMLIRHRSCYQKIPEFSDMSNSRFGYRKLRESIASYLLRSRGIECESEQIIITNGSRLDLFCRLILNSGDYVAIENPSYPAARTILTSYEAIIKPFEVDEEGLITSALESSPLSFKVIHVSPSHNEPKGTVLSESRRSQLMDWSNRHNTLIFESDFDSVYRYGNRPVKALHGLSNNDNVFYSGSFWLSLGPLSSIAYMVIPKSYVSHFERALKLLHFNVSPLEQCALADFIEEGHFERFLHKSNVLYRKKRQALIQSLTVSLGNRVQFAKQSGSKHLLIRFNSTHPHELILKSAIEAGLPLSSTSAYYMQAMPEGEFMISFGNLQLESISIKVTKFCEILLSSQKTKGL